MKKQISCIHKIGLIAILTGLSGFFSCHPLDEVPPGVLDPDTFFESQEDALSALTAAYAVQYGGTQHYYLRAWTYITDWITDDMGAGFGGEIADRKPVDRFKYPTDYVEFYNVWWNAYMIVNRAGNVITKVSDMPDEAFKSPELKRRILAEARFLRAQNYFNLVRLFGDVVFHGDSYVSDPVGDADMSRTDVETIYSFIISELEIAEQDLWTRDLVEKGRATRGAAQAFLSKVYLTRAGWRLDARTHIMVQGDASNWAKAAEWARKIMDEGDYNLRANYREVFPAHEDDYDLYENNEEHIYFVNCIEATKSFETKLYWGPRLANGEGGYSTFVGEKELIFSFEPGDQRDEVTNLYYVIDELEEEQPLDESNQNYWWPEMNIPHVNKFLPDEEDYKFPPSGNATGTNYPLFRFSEVLLIYAEAVNEANGSPTADAIEAFNRVRRRAGLSEWPNVNNVDGNPYPNTQDGFRQAIRQERRWELCYEGKRLFDLFRWGILEETFHARAAAPDATVQDSIRALNVDMKHNLHPIPFAEIQKNPNLTQNPGY